MDIRLDPHPGQSGTLSRGEAQPRQHGDQRLLQPADVTDIVGLWNPPLPLIPWPLEIQRNQGEQRISHQLSRPMIGDIPSAIDPVDGDALLLEMRLAPEQILLFAAPAKRVYVRMFNKQ